MHAGIQTHSRLSKVQEDMSVLQVSAELDQNVGAMQAARPPKAPTWNSMK
jgi:hypothetical protein